MCAKILAKLLKTVRNRSPGGPKRREETCIIVCRRVGGIVCGLGLGMVLGIVLAIVLGRAVVIGRIFVVLLFVP